MSKAKEYYESLYPKTNPSISDREWINRISPISRSMNHKTLEDVNDKVKARFNEILEEQNVDNSYEIIRVLERTQCQTLDWILIELEKLKL